MAPLDYAVVVACLAGIAWLGVRMKGRADESVDEFIVGGRSMPFWLVGLANTATEVNSSTPLSDSRKMRTDGISGQWFTWGALISHSFSLMWFSRLWRRSRVTTAVEFNAIRYSTWGGSASRLYDSTVLAIINGSIWSALGLVGIKKIATVLLGLPPTLSVLGLAVPSDWAVVLGTVAVTLGYSAVSGLKGVVWTDAVEVTVTFVCAFILLFILYGQLGGPVGLRDRVMARPDGDFLLTTLPEIGPAFIVLFFVQPIFSLGSYNPMVQRLLSLRSEREVIPFYLFNSTLNLLVKPWPYLIAGLAGLFLISDASLLDAFPPIVTENGTRVPDYEMMYPLLIREYLPVGITGLMAAGFLFAFMSSFSTNIHSNGSIFVNDLYRPFLRKDATESHYVNVTRAFMVVQTVVSIGVAVVVNDLLWMFIFAITVHNADGALKMIRFVWWRINGYGEFASKVTGLATVLFAFSPAGDALVQTLGQAFGQVTNDAFYATRFLVVVLTSTTVGLVVTLATPPEPREILDSFYRRVRPYGAWGPVAARNPGYRHTDPTGLLWGMTFAAIAFVFAGAFLGIGIFLALWPHLVGGAVVSVLSVAYLLWGTRRLYGDGDGSEGDGLGSDADLVAVAPKTAAGA